MTARAMLTDTEAPGEAPKRAARDPVGTGEDLRAEIQLSPIRFPEALDTDTGIHQRPIRFHGSRIIHFRPCVHFGSRHRLIDPTFHD